MFARAHLATPAPAARPEPAGAGGIFALGISVGGFLWSAGQTAVDVTGTVLGAAGTVVEAAGTVVGAVAEALDAV